MIIELNVDDVAISILKYIRNNQANANSITKEEISRQMEKNEICSRPTTLKLIRRLLDKKIILDNRKRKNTFSSLIINPSFNFREIEKNLIKEIQSVFGDLEK